MQDHGFQSVRLSRVSDPQWLSLMPHCLDGSSLICLDPLGWDRNVDKIANGQAVAGSGWMQGTDQPCPDPISKCLNRYASSAMANPTRSQQCSAT